MLLALDAAGEGRALLELEEAERGQVLVRDALHALQVAHDVEDQFFLNGAVLAVLDLDLVLRHLAVECENAGAQLLEGHSANLFQ